MHELTHGCEKWKAMGTARRPLETLGGAAARYAQHSTGSNNRNMLMKITVIKIMLMVMIMIMITTIIIIVQQQP